MERIEIKEWVDRLFEEPTNLNPREIVELLEGILLKLDERGYRKYPNGIKIENSWLLCEAFKDVFGYELDEII